MKHTLTINTKNTPEHIIHLDQQKIPLTIKPLPPHTAYSIQNKAILLTTTQTLQHHSPQRIRQKNKKIRQKTYLIIIKNTKTIPMTIIETIKEHPLIKTYTTTKEKLTTLLKQIIQENTPPTKQKTKTKHNKKGYTLYHDNTPIKTYKNKEYAEQITKILNTQPTLTLQEAEYKAQRQYYKNISYDKTNKNYKITLKQKTINTHKKLKHAIQERNLQKTNTEQEEETLCHKQTKNNTEPLPPTPWNNTLRQTKKEHNKYQTRKNKKTTTHNNPDTIKLIHDKKITPTTILNTIKPDRNIKTKNNTYQITTNKNKKFKIYYNTPDKTEARYIRDKLEENQYDTTQIPTYQQQYTHDKKQYQKTYKQKNKIIDYYQNTKTKLTTQHDRKEQYQQHQIQQNTKYNRTPEHQ